MLEILRAFLKTSSGTLANLLLNSVAIKILAAMLGPAAIGLLSILRQIYNTTLLVATMSGQVALIQGGASRQGKDRSDYLRTLLWLFVAGGSLAALGLVLLAPSLAQWLLHRNDETAHWLVRLLALPVLLTVLTGFTLGVLNIHRLLGRIAVIQIAAAASTALLAYPAALLVQQGHETALVASILITPLVTFAFSIIILAQQKLLQPLLYNIHAGFRWAHARSFYTFAGVTVVAALYQNAIMLVIRSVVVRQAGLSTAGIFDAAWTLSMTYVTLITAAFSTYFMPTLSAAASHDFRRELIERMFRFVTVLAGPIILAVIVFKPLVIQILFSAEFLPALLLMRWMLVGDFFKLSSWVLAYPMLATADLKMVLWSELITNSFFLAAGFVSLYYFQSIEGLAVAFLVMYSGHFVFTLLYARRRHGVHLPAATMRAWLLGLGLVVTFSLFTWSADQISAASVLALVAAAAGFYWVAFSPAERLQLARMAGATLRLSKEKNP